MPHIQSLPPLAFAICLSMAACGDDMPHAALADAAADVPDTSEVGANDVEVTARRRCELPPDAAVTLPADDARHAVPTEWYYWTGHLRSEDGRWFGFHITVLVAGAPGRGVILAHHSLTRAAATAAEGDTANAPAGGSRYAHGFELGLEQELPARGFAFDLGLLSAKGYDGDDVLASALDDSRLALTLTDPRGPVVRHGNGFQDYGGGISTYYYARPRQVATGTLEVDGETLAVTGNVWFDHQWGTLASPDSSRWDWIAMQLDDGRDLMVVNLPTPTGDVFSFAELTDSDCVTEILYGDAVTFSGRKTWQSPASGCTYPMGWDIGVGDQRFVLSPLTEDQEMLAEPIPYWEGAATVSGSATGRAYVELVGYCE